MSELRVGILQADSVVEPLQAEHGDYPGMFMRLLADVGIAPQQCTVINAQAQSLPTVDSADVYVITGSRHSVYDDLPWIAPLAEFVGQALADGRKVVGICFGHQLLAHFFGGRVGPAEQGWRVGVHRNEVLTTPSWMQPPLTSYATLSSHQDQVQVLPPGAQLLARHPACPVAAFVMPEGALAIQGHPEFDKAYARALMNRRQDLIGDETYREGLASLNEPTSSAVVAAWLRNFLRSDKSDNGDE